MLVAVCSLKGSPGVTTLSVALAARWPRGARCVLVECDPSGGDVATRFSLAVSPGLVSLAAATRRSSEPDVLWQHAQALPGGLPVVCAPPGADQAHAALAALAAEPTAPAEPDLGVVYRASRVPGVVVIADCGRVDPGSAALPIVRAADAMLLVSRAHADDLAHLATRLDTVGRWSRRPVLLLTGAGYATTDIARELGVLPLARIPDDRRGAGVLCGRPGGHRGPARSPLGRTAARIAAALSPPRAQPFMAQHRPGPAPGGPVRQPRSLTLVSPPTAPEPDPTVGGPIPRVSDQLPDQLPDDHASRNGFSS